MRKRLNVFVQIKFKTVFFSEQMEPLYSVLIFSKYSSNCKKVFDLVQNSGVDFSNLQLLCIDNPKIRNRIKENKQLEINSVPCILSIFNNGGVEKYQGNVVFDWINNIISRFAPPPPSQPPPPPRQIKQERLEEREEREEPIARPQRRERQVERERPVEQDEDDRQERRDRKTKVPPRMKRIVEEPTSIEDLPMDDSDRHKSPAKPRRLQQGDTGEFIEDEDLFSGEPPDDRREPGNVIKSTTQRTAPDPHGTRARADDIARGREMTEAEINPTKRPVGARRP